MRAIAETKVKMKNAAMKRLKIEDEEYLANTLYNDGSGPHLSPSLYCHLCALLF